MEFGNEIFINVGAAGRGRAVFVFPGEGRLSSRAGARGKTIYSNYGSTNRDIYVRKLGYYRDVPWRILLGKLYTVSLNSITGNYKDVTCRGPGIRIGRLGM